MCLSSIHQKKKLGAMQMSSPVKDSHFSARLLNAVCACNIVKVV